MIPKEPAVMILEKIKDIHNFFTEIANENYRKYAYSCTCDELINITQQDYEDWEKRMKAFVEEEIVIEV
jgi:7-keto-8-aminopelargonate synthetase-like enzyme